MRFIISILTVLLLNGCVGVRTSDNVAAQTQKGGLLGLSRASDLETSSLQAVKNEKRVAIPYFRIAFYTENNPGGYKSTTNRITIRSKLVGATPELLQAVTDEAYKDFVNQLNAHGFEVISIDDLNQSPTYRAIKQTRTQHKDKALFGPDAIYVSPTGMRVSDSSITRLREVRKIMDELNASVMDVTLYITYLSQSVDTVGGLITTGVNVGQTATIIPGSEISFYGLKASRCQGYCPDTVAKVRLGQPVFDTTKVGELKNSTTSADKVADITATALSWMSTGTKLHNTKRYELHVDEEKYRSVVTSLIHTASKKMLDPLKP